MYFPCSKIALTLSSKNWQWTQVEGKGTDPEQTCNLNLEFRGNGKIFPIGWSGGHTSRTDAQRMRRILSDFVFVEWMSAWGHCFAAFAAYKHINATFFSWSFLAIEEWIYSMQHRVNFRCRNKNDTTWQKLKRNAFVSGNQIKCHIDEGLIGKFIASNLNVWKKPCSFFADKFLDFLLLQDKQKAESNWFGMFLPTSSLNDTIMGTLEQAPFPVMPGDHLSVIRWHATHPSNGLSICNYFDAAADWWLCFRP